MTIDRFIINLKTVNKVGRQMTDQEKIFAVSLINSDIGKMPAKRRNAPKRDKECETGNLQKEKSKALKKV